MARTLSMNLFTTRMMVALAAGAVGAAGAAGAQTPSGGGATDPVEALVHEALEANPGIRAAEARVEAARAAIGPAGALPDPMLMAGIMNHAIGGSATGELNPMAMRTIGLAQTLPYPGKLGLQRRIAEGELAAAEAGLEAARWALIEVVKDAYYELAFLDHALEILRRNEGLLTSLLAVTESRYGVGAGSQADVLKARVEASRLAEEAVAMTERRRAALARLNAALDRPTEGPVEAIEIPERIARAAVPADALEVRFTSAELGARAAGSPLPPLADLQERAVRQSPGIRAHEAAIRAQTARVELARRAHLPDFDLSVQYGQRGDLHDLISATVTVPIPVRRGQRQDLEAKEAEARLTSLEAEHHARANAIRAEVASAYADMERERAQLGLFVRSILPQGRAALESATSSFQVGRVDFLTLLENQATLFAYEIAYYRSLTGFADRLAELESLVGEEVIR